MTSNGIALGTLIAQYSGLALAFLFLFKKYKKFLIPVKKDALAEIEAVKRFFSINKNIFIRTFCIIIVHTFFTSRSAGINDNILAVNSLLLQYLMLFSFVADGFAYAGEALTGKFIGSRDGTRLKKVVKRLFQWGFGLAGLFTLAYWLGGESMLSLLTSNEDLKPIAKEYLPWVWLIPITGVAAFTWDGIYIGATAGPAMRNTLLLATFAVFFPVFFFSRAVLGNHALWLAMILFMLARGLIQTAWRQKAIYHFRGMH
jgi:MATE family multidrug resistance protein